MSVFHYIQGFYSVYGEIFAKVAAEDVPYMDKDEEAMPAFGEATYIQSYSICVVKLLNVCRMPWIFAVQAQHYPLNLKFLLVHIYHVFLCIYTAFQLAIQL